MRVAIIGSRGLEPGDIGKYLPSGVTEIVTGGAKGVDRCAKMYALESGLKLTEFLPEYERYGKNAPLLRNIQIIRHSDRVIALWDGKSRGTKFVIDKCGELKVQIDVYLLR